MLDPASVSFRAAGQDDAHAIAELHADSWRRHYRGAYSDAFLDGDVAGYLLVVWTDRLRYAWQSLARPPGGCTLGSGGEAVVELVVEDAVFVTMAADAGPADGGAGPTGMELIERQLGGTIIEEIDEP